MSDLANLIIWIEQGVSSRLAPVLDRIPPTSMTSVARSLVSSSDLATRLNGLILLIDGAARGSAPRTARDLAAAILFVSLRHIDDPRWGSDIVAECAAQAAGTIATAYEQLGRHRAIPLLARRMDRLLKSRTNGVSIDSIKLKAVNALIELGDLEQAESLVLELIAAGCSDPSLPIVKDRIEGRLRRVVDLADGRSPDQQAKDDHAATMTVAVDAVARLAAGVLPDDIAAMLRSEAAKADSAPQSAEEVHRRAVDSIDRISGMIGLGQSPALQWRSRVNNASRIFFQGDAAPRAELEAALATFKAAIAWSDQNNEREDGHQARWCAYIAQRRLGDPGAALDRLEELAGRLEADRSRITDPLRFPTGFPMLAAARAECADMIGDPRRMLLGIEASKGRTLANLVRSATRLPYDEKMLAIAPERITRIVAELGIVYVSYLAIDNAVFAVAVWPDGQWEHSRIPMDEAFRRRLSGRLEPATWVKPTQAVALDMGAELAPLIDWLLPRLATHPPASHLVFSPDGELHMWPLDMAHTPTGPLGLRIGVSRVHGVDALRRIAERAPVRPARSIAAFIPAADEGEVAAKAEAMAKTIEPLPAPRRIEGETADEAMFGGLNASGALLHINAHGVFPEPRFGAGVDPNPYRSAGLLLADHGALPLRSHSWTHRLTPALVLESAGFSADRATIVLQGCVSGLAKEGLAGDALGLEFAFLARGADTVLATQWNVDYRSAGAFCRHFYQAWYGQGTSRIEAWRRAAAAVYDDPEKAAVHEWAAFSLSGDWR